MPIAHSWPYHCNERLAYYKPPGWIHIVQSLPTTGTQKIQKHNIYPAGTDPRARRRSSTCAR